MDMNSLLSLSGSWGLAMSSLTRQLPPEKGVLLHDLQHGQPLNDKENMSDVLDNFMNLMTKGLS